MTGVLTPIFVGVYCRRPYTPKGQPPQPEVTDLLGEHETDITEEAVSFMQNKADRLIKVELWEEVRPSFGAITQDELRDIRSNRTRKAYGRWARYLRAFLLRHKQ